MTKGFTQKPKLIIGTKHQYRHAIYMGIYMGTFKFK